MKPWQLDDYWISLKQRTGQRRVIPIALDRDVARLLKRYRGSFAVMSRSRAAVDPELRIVLRIPE